MDREDPQGASSLPVPESADELEGLLPRSMNEDEDMEDSESEELNENPIELITEFGNNPLMERYDVDRGHSSSEHTL